MDRKTILVLALVVVGAVLKPTSELRALDARGLKLTQPMVVEGIYLRAAVYDVHWELQGTYATVTFSRKGRAVATVQGETSTVSGTVTNDTLYFSKHSDGYLYINALGFAKTNKRVVFPVLRSRPNVVNDDSATNTLMENDWRNRARPLPPFAR